MSNIILMYLLCRDAFGKQALISWWHGKGGLIDYTNEDALEWWHKQMNKVADTSIYSCMNPVKHLLYF